jgi:hypothetical protein
MKENLQMFKNLGIFLVVLLAIALVVVGPFLVIWAWNTLFGALLTIAYTVWTWLAVLIIGVFIRSDVKVSKKS